MKSEEIPDSLKEAWPILRETMDTVVVKMIKDLVGKEGISFEMAGAAAFYCESLLSRMDSIMQRSHEAPPRAARPRLQTMSSSTPKP